MTTHDLTPSGLSDFEVAFLILDFCFAWCILVWSLAMISLRRRAEKSNGTTEDTLDA